MMETQQKVQQFINKLSEEVEKDGYVKFSTCDASNWDKPTWLFRNQIKKALENKGYKVNVTLSYGVIDYSVTKQLNF